MIRKEKLLECDVPSPYTGRIYPLDEMKNAVENYHGKIDEDLALGINGFPGDITFSITEISHKVTKMWFEDNVLFGEIKFFDTPIMPGMIAQDIIDAGIDYRIALNMTGTIFSDSNTASNLTICSTSFVYGDQCNVDGFIKKDSLNIRDVE